MDGYRLRLARKAAGLSVRELAASLDPPVSAQAISKYENGRMMPSSKVASGLCKSLGISLEYLLGGRVATLKSVEWRKRSRATARERSMAEAVVLDRLEHYIAIEAVLELEETDPFTELRSKFPPDMEGVEAKALEIRGKWNLGFDPIASMTGLLEGKGLKVLELDLPDGIDGMACKVEKSEGRPFDVIAVSAATGIERKRFNLAHELAHRIFTTDGPSPKEHEKAMNRFAGAFLVPGEHLVAEAGSHRERFTSQEILGLKKKYGVSAAALLMRLGQVGILKKGAIDYAFKSYARKWRTTEPEPLRNDEGFAAFEKPQRFENLVWRALGDRMISPLRASQMLGVPRSSIEERIRDSE